MRKGKRGIAIILAAAFMCSSIIMDVPVAEAKSPAVVLNKTKLNLYKGERITLKAKVTNKKTGTKFTWKSSNKKVAAVSSKGSVKAVKSGTAKITVSMKNSSNKAVCSVKVGDYAKKLMVESADSVILTVGKTSQIKAAVTPASVLTKGVTFTSMDKTIAVVDSEGVITAKGKGTTKILIKTKSINKKEEKLTKTIYVSVNEAETGDGETGGGEGSGTESKSPIVGEPEVNGNTTTYTLDKSYKDSVAVVVTINGKTWSRNGKVESVLSQLAGGQNSSISKDGITVSKGSGEWWTAVSDDTQQTIFELKAVENSQGNSSYGQIVLVNIAGNVSVSVR